MASIVELKAEYCEKNPENCSPDDQYWLGLAYREGKDVPKDEAKAKKWFKRAADRGHPEAGEALKNIKTIGHTDPPAPLFWDKFDENTIVKLVQAMDGPHGNPMTARQWLKARVPNPTLDFVRDYKSVLLRTWLLTYNDLEGIVARLMDAGVGPLGKKPTSRDELLRYIEKTKATKTLQTFVLEAMLRFPEKLPEDWIPSGSKIILNPKDQPPDQREPHPFQEEAWDQLDKALREFESSKRFEGIVVMPTGSGKTYTAIHWLLSKVLVKEKYKVLWLAHRHELLNQAARDFVRLSGLLSQSDKQEFRLRIVSGMHCKTSQITKDEDVVIASVSSLARNPYVRRELINQPNLFLVIDEAHHAPATSYRSIVEELHEKESFSILGITATPTRTIEKERPTLAKLFGGKIIKQVEIRSLIEQNILARPRMVTVKTKADAEIGVTAEDRQHLVRFHDLSEGWLERIANIVERNGVIVRHYLDNRAHYGKTLIFAINVAHAVLLSVELKKNGVDAEYVASYRPDGTEIDVNLVTEQFQKGNLEVLVNVQILTEGVDLPKVQTVFLTRPTASEILLRQMIGRGLRGLKMKGTEKAYLVSFEDHWKEFDKWESPFNLVSDIKEAADAIEVFDGDGAPPPPEGRLPDQQQTVLPWDIITFVVQRIEELRKTIQPLDVFEAVPTGWYVLEDKNPEGEDRQSIIPLYEHDLPCWEAFVENLVSLREKTDQNNSLDEKSLSSLTKKYFEDFFGDCDHPKPSEYHVDLVTDFILRGGEKPKPYNYEDRKECDPYTIAKEIRTRNLRDNEKDELIGERYTRLAQAIYPTLRDYERAIEDARMEMKYGDDSTRDKKAVPVFSEIPKKPLREGPAHDLAQLMREVLERGRSCLGRNDPLPHAGETVWTGRLVKGWYGKAYWDVMKPAGHGQIRINRLLDSPSVDVDTIRFLLWHEYLHLYLKAGHTKEFRRLEHMWPGYSDADHFLDTLNEAYGVQYW